MIRQFVVPSDLQQFLTGLPSARLANVVWDTNIPTQTLVIPTNPQTVRRVLIFDKSGFSSHATPNPLEYNCYLKTLDLTVETEVTFARGI